MDDDVFDVESPADLNAPMDGEYPGQPDATPYTQEELEEFCSNGSYWGQESMGDRKYIEVLRNEETLEVEPLIDGKSISPKEISDLLLEAYGVFGAYALAVDEYKEGNKKKWAISQAVFYKDKGLSRTIAEVRISAARNIYGYLLNKGAGDRFMLLNTAKSASEKRELENPLFFEHNRGYER